MNAFQFQISSKKYATTKRCVDYSIKLLDWVTRSEFYIPIRFEVGRIKKNLENMRDVLEQLQRARNLATNEKPEAYNAQEARKLLQWMVEQVTQEEDKEESFECRPITHLVNMVIATRVIHTKS